MQCSLLIALFCVVFFQGTFSERLLGVSYLTQGEPDSVLTRLLVELLVAANFVWLWFHDTVRLPSGSLWFGLYGMWAVISGVVIEKSPLYGFMYCRYTLYAYIVYLVMSSHSFAPNEMRRLTRVLLTCFVIQVAVSGAQVFIANERVEWRVGTMTVSGGELATIFPLLALCYAAAYYFYVRQSWWVLIAGLSFGLVGYASGKRAVYFLIPIGLCVIVLLHYLREHGRSTTSFFRLAVHLAIAGTAVLPAFMYGISHSHGINAGAEGTIQELVRGAADFAVGYENGVDEKGFATGRTSASMRVVQAVSDQGLRTALFGWGPSSLSHRADASNGPTAVATLGIAYGIVGWSYDTISVGLPGAFFYLGAFWYTTRATWRSMSRRRLHPSWKAIAFGTLSALVVHILCYLFYGSVFMFNGVIPFVILFYAGAITRSTASDVA
jgi:hypothetical protein